MLIEDTALVLRRTPFGDTSLVVQLFSRYAGIVGVMARGIRKSKKGDRAALAGFHTVGFASRGRRREGLGTLTRLEIVKARHRLSRNMVGAAAAQVMLEVVYRFLPAGDPATDVFELLESVYDRLEEDDDPVSVIAAAQVWLLRLLGYGWQVDVCGHCSLASGLAFFSVEHGYVVCGGCRNHFTKELSPISAELLETMDRCGRRLGFALDLKWVELEQLFGFGQLSLAQRLQKPLNASEQFVQMVKLPSFFV